LPIGVVHDLDLQAARVARPPLEAAGVGGVGPHPLEARQSRCGPSEQGPAAVAVLEAGAVNAGEEHEAGGVDEQVALAAVQPLGAVVAARRAAAPGRPNGLAVDHGPARVGVAALGLATRPRSRSCASRIGPSRQRRRKWA
jgi:hypothetical protein